MNEAIAKILRHLISNNHGSESLCGLELADQFDPSASDAATQARSLGAAFLLCMARNKRNDAARAYLAQMRNDAEVGDLACFLERGLILLDEELGQALDEIPALQARITHAAGALDEPNPSAPYRPVWEVFFPEGLAALDDPEASVKALAERRKVQVQSANPDPISNPVKQILFTSNALLTAPMHRTDLDALHLSKDLKNQIQNWEPGEQRYWYDHPIPLCIAPEANEILHGLKGLSQALAFERERHPQWAESRLNCVCSVSVTHDGLQELARGYISEILQQAQGLDGLDIYLFTERDTDRLKQDILYPAAERYFPETPAAVLDEIIGVDGEYGRHYSFLKAVAAWWQAMIDPKIKATFKIDLDQVFPQAELADQSGASAFEHFMSPLWGAHGIDSWGQEVEMGMLAGALVNQSDIAKGIFTPDVPWPAKPPSGDETIFFSALSQAQSTQAEMMARYNQNGLDGRSSCLQRIHVTGGTNGILIDSLRKHRPFTPTFIGRAEDQAYLLSVLFADKPALRYLHQPGLIMRHDKEDLIPGAIAASRIGKIIGDYVRIIWYSHYCRALPWGLSRTKEAIDPFTGCFASNLPMHLVYLRLTLKAAGLFAQGAAKGEAEAENQALELLQQGSRRLGNIIDTLEADRSGLAARLDLERKGWQLFYDLIGRIEEGIQQGEECAMQLKEKALELASACRVMDS